MPPTIAYKPLTHKSVPLLRTFVKEYYEFDDLKYEPSGVTKALGKLLSDPTLGRAWIVYHGVLPVGYVLITFGFILEFHGRHLVIDELYVRNEFRNRGLGKRILKFVEKFAKENKIGVLRLEVEKRNKRALKIYKSIGYETHPRILMTKLLG